jgi:hypothetical protein
MIIKTKSGVFSFLLQHFTAGYFINACQFRYLLTGLFKRLNLAIRIGLICTVLTGIDQNADITAISCVLFQMVAYQ